MASIPATISTVKRSNRTKSAWVGMNMPAARLGLIVNLLMPASVLMWDAAHHNLGVDAVNYAIHTTGLFAVIYLALSLAVTPLRTITGWQWLTQFRRSLGVYAFYYAAAHLFIYFWFDRGRSVSATFHEITNRYYLTIGFASLAIMAPLWATSFNLAIQWMGGKKWKLLHRLAYAAAILAGIHYYLQSKSFKRNPNIYLSIIGALLLWRVITAIVHRIQKQSQARVIAAGKAGAMTAGKARHWKGELKVVGMFRETPDVRTFRLAPPDGGPIPFTFSAGQFLNLALIIDGKSVGRSYTIASPPTRDGYIEFTVKREQNGQVSSHLHDKLMAGESIRVSGPVGRFVFAPDGEDAVLLVAGGVGITPVMSILRDLTDRCWVGKIDLVLSVRTMADVIFAAELDFLAARHPNVRLHMTITRDAPADWSGPRGRITADLLRDLVPDFATRRALVCGPDAMAKAVRDELLSSGVIERRITLESFTPAAAVMPGTAREQTADAAPAVTVMFAQSNQSAPLPANRTVLDAAESAGVVIDSQCRSGICGTCRCKLLEGSVRMPMHDALSDADEADGYILACQAYADTDITIDA